MASSIPKKEFIQRLALQMNTDEKTATAWMEGVTETIWETFKQGRGAPLPGVGSFYLDQRGDSCAFKFNPSQKLRKLLGWSSTYKGIL